MALREIHQNPQTLWTVRRLSELAGISRTAFTRRFVSAVGQPPMAYLIGRRLIRNVEMPQPPNRRSGG